jgi:hypothetical protein
MSYNDDFLMFYPAAPFLSPVKEGLHFSSECRLRN